MLGKDASPDSLPGQVSVNFLRRIGANQNEKVRPSGNFKTFLPEQRFQFLPFPPPLSEGMKLDDYRIVRELYSSKWTQVYLAVDEASGERVVVKTPSVNYEDDPNYLQLFTREEWVGKRVSSPHIVDVVEQRRQRSFLYYVTEYVEGPTLRQWMHDHPDPAMDQVRGIIGQIAQGLRALHRKEMIHQDLKPANIVIDADGTVKIIDFGSAKIASLEEIASPTEGPGLLGTVDYTAPEYLLGRAPTNRSDIYSLGVIAYEMLTGKHPYGKRFSARRQVDKCRYIPASKPNGDIPAWIDGALEKAVHYDPARRYDTLSEFINDLSRPNPKFLRAEQLPLVERNPVAFWQGLAGIFLFIIFLLIYRLTGQ